MAIDKLTPSQDKFATLVAKGMTQREAYIKSHPKAHPKGINQIDVRACNLAKHPGVKAKIMDIREGIRAGIVMSELERGQKLSEIARNSAFELNSVAAIKELNKMDGTYARANNPITSRVSSGKVAMAIQALIIDEMGDIPKQADDAEFAELEELETVEDENFEEGLDKDDNLLYNGEEED